MEKILSFVLEHLELCIACVVAFITLLLQVLKKKPVKVIDGLYAALTKVIPGFIVYAEEQIGAGKGKTKMDVVINLATAYINKLYPGLKDLSPYIQFVKSQVEVILSTPQKKGD